MIYLTAAGGNFRIIVLDVRDIDKLKSPHPWFSPDRTSLVAFTPDPDWLLSRIRVGPGTPQDIALAIDEAARRPQAELVAAPLVGANGQPIKLIPAEATAEPSVLAEAHALIKTLCTAITEEPSPQWTEALALEVNRVVGRMNVALAGGA